MNNQTFKQKIVSFIGHIGWKLFCWSYRGGEKQYLDDIHDEIIRQNS